MDVKHATAILLVASLALGFGPRLVRADEAARRWDRNVDPSRQVMVPFRELALVAATRVTEAPRLLTDHFPYLAAAPQAVSGTRAVELVPETLGLFLQQASAGEGRPPVRVPTAGAAIEAVRLFLAGPLVSDPGTAERLIRAGRRLGAELRHLEVEVTDHRPDAWTPTARAVSAGGDGAAIEAWTVSLVACELDRVLRLVHVTARVTVEGEITLERHPIVDGPFTTWQTAVMGDETAAMQSAEEEMRAEVLAARKAYAEALRPARTLDAFWAVGRILHRMEDVRPLFGQPDRDVGSGIHIWTYDLDDGTAVVFGGGADRIVYVRHVRGATRPLGGFETLGTIYVGPER